MAGYFEAAAACDLAVLEAAPHGILDTERIIDAAARREVRLLRCKPATCAALSTQPSTVEKACQTTNLPPRTYKKAGPLPAATTTTTITPPTKTLHAQQPTTSGNIGTHLTRDTRSSPPEEKRSFTGTQDLLLAELAEERRTLFFERENVARERISQEQDHRHTTLTHSHSRRLASIQGRGNNANAPAGLALSPPARSNSVAEYTDVLTEVLTTHDTFLEPHLRSSITRLLSEDYAPRSPLIDPFEVSPMAKAGGSSPHTEALTPTTDAAPFNFNKKSRAGSVIRCGARRFTFLKQAEEEEEDERVSGWKTMQARLNEIKMQTLLQSYSQGEGNGEPVYRVVLTGGPCAGKSTGMVTLKERLEHNGFNVFCVPEAATILIQGGGDKSFQSPVEDALFVFQLSLLETQLALEDAFYALAKSCGKKAVLLCDRGSMDGRAFCNEDVWEKILATGDWSSSELRDQRYDLVLHLVTAANGAREYYGTDTNTARTETPEQATEQDNKLLSCWAGFHKLRIIDNSTSFKKKMERCLQPILELVGIQTGPGTHKRYKLLDPPTNEEISKHLAFNESTSTIHVLRGSKAGNTIKIIHREGGKSNNYTYQCNRKQNEEVFKVERPLSQNVYQSLLGQVDPKVHVVRKNVVSFVFDHQYIELGYYQEPAALVGLATLDVQTTRYINKEVDKLPNFPPFLAQRSLEDITHLI